MSVPDAGTTLIVSSTTVKATTLNKKMPRFMSVTFPSSSDTRFVICIPKGEYEYSELRHLNSAAKG